MLPAFATRAVANALTFANVSVFAGDGKLTRNEGKCHSQILDTNTLSIRGVDIIKTGCRYNQNGHRCSRRGLLDMPKGLEHHQKPDAGLLEEREKDEL